MMTLFLVAILAVTLNPIPVVAQIWADMFIDNQCTQPLAPFLEQNYMYNNLHYWTKGNVPQVNVTDEFTSNTPCAPTPPPVGWNATDPRKALGFFVCNNITDTNSGILQVGEYFNQSNCYNRFQYFELNIFAFEQTTGAPGEGCHKGYMKSTWANHTRLSKENFEPGYNFNIWGRFSCVAAGQGSVNDAISTVFNHMLLIVSILLALMI